MEVRPLRTTAAPTPKKAALSRNGTRVSPPLRSMGCSRVLVVSTLRAGAASWFARAGDDGTIAVMSTFTTLLDRCRAAGLALALALALMAAAAAPAAAASVRVTLAPSVAASPVDGRVIVALSK